MRHLLGLTVCLCIVGASTAVFAQGLEASRPIRAGRYSFSGGGGFSQESFSISAGVGYFVLDGLMPGVRYRYTRYTDKLIDDNASLHDLNVYLRYYLDISPSFYPFLVGDLGYLKMLEWGNDVESQMAEMFSVMGGVGAAYYLSSHFYVDVFAGMRRYLDPPTWSYLHTEPSQFEWGMGFGAAF